MEQDDSNQKLDSEYVCSCIKKLIPSIRVVQEDVLATLLAKKPEPAQLRAAVIDKLNRKIPSHHRNAVYEVHIPLHPFLTSRSFSNSSPKPTNHLFPPPFTPITSRSTPTSSKPSNSPSFQVLSFPLLFQPIRDLFDKHKTSDILERIVSYFCSHTLYRKQLLHFLSPFLLSFDVERKIYRAFTCLLSRYVPDISLDEKVAQYYEISTKFLTEKE